MLKKVFFAVLMIVLLAGIVGCDSAEPQLQPEYVIERDDLIMVNSSTVKYFHGSTGVYVFFFEDYPTRLAFPTEVQIRFDPSVNKPIVRIESFKWQEGTSETMRGVEVFFRDREQMQEYWVV